MVLLVVEIHYVDRGTDSADMVPVVKELLQ